MKKLLRRDGLPFQYISELIGGSFSDGYELPINEMKKYDQVGAFKVKNNLITDYKKCPGSEDPIVYTVESITTDGIKLFQVGTYENPLTFRQNGKTLTKFRSRNWINWNDYVLIPFEK